MIFWWEVNLTFCKKVNLFNEKAIFFKVWNSIKLHVVCNVRIEALSGECTELHVWAPRFNVNKGIYIKRNQRNRSNISPTSGFEPLDIWLSQRSLHRLISGFWRAKAVQKPSNISPTSRFEPLDIWMSPRFGVMNKSARSYKSKYNYKSKSKYKYKCKCISKY